MPVGFRIQAVPLVCVSVAAFEDWLAAIARGSSWVSTADLKRAKRYVADASFGGPPADVGAA
ncbi:hypothetical protein GLOTRDRAFT_131823 [Gloeophyllum trabeum ATCC 11539]|uniref:Uncharacterized protein n=1 Tax=Gloeophyllum trabeum (strain ATCC 11539 / FP-39264 / Madison 617) TaxID=670483 RepID=S7REE5_GLOTA|nr:uncharacterized protein GLOTRDRAFT_131823 [Gloeophyllum trabeum ATCC 11539]EPQ52590.1 hypothetical protein GLOTRDRAFT_131823 [Gloeophyllum trabeum ATCC 11539]